MDLNFKSIQEQTRNSALPHIRCSICGSKININNYKVLNGYVFCGVEENNCKELIKAAQNACTHYYDNGTFPEDEWYESGNENVPMDLNLWTDRDEDDNEYAVGTLYPIIDDETNTDKFIEIYRQQL
jgi:hypothetical protein